MAVQYAKLDHTPTVVFTPGKSLESFLKNKIYNDFGAFWFCDNIFSKIKES